MLLEHALGLLRMLENSLQGCSARENLQLRFFVTLLLQMILLSSYATPNL